MLGIRLPNGVPADLGPSLTRADVHVSIRGDSIRVAPYLYNDTGDIDRFLDVLRRAVA
jgi:selenocysteine lyase/cysteine desulfurase